MPPLRVCPTSRCLARLALTIAAFLTLSGHCPSAPLPVGHPPIPAPAPQLRTTPFSINEEDRAWWAFQKRTPAPPEIMTPDAAHPVDVLLGKTLRRAGLTPSPPASPRERLRRAYFDLLGWPPTPQEVARFEQDPSPAAWGKIIDHLLSQPQYGERWARHWLDVVRYAESNGYERDGMKPHAWRYRDYVIRSFNQDKPYNRFILEQLAGDELPDGGQDGIIATGFYRLHVWDDEPDNTVVAEFDDLDDIMVTTSAAFMGLTVGCARCHDHKFDPISQQNYYEMLAYFRSINPYGQHHTGGGGRGTGKITRPLATAEDVQKFEKSKAEELKPLREQLKSITDAEAKKQLEARIQGIENRPPPYDFALAIHEDPVKTTHVLHRGDAFSPREEVQPGIPELIRAGRALPKVIPSATSSGRRTALAQWLIQPEHPLTARVMVNRLWQHHFGRGLVKTPNDFGRTGTAPTHPELLDFLATELIRNGWRLKPIHKLIMTSQAYAMSSRTDRPEGIAKDEANEWLWRRDAMRLDAEALRDSMLSVSGLLNLKQGGPSFYPALPPEVHKTQDSAGKGWTDSSIEEQNRRSIYMVIKRALIPPLMEVFDYNTTTVPVGNRPTTTVAPQALMLLNDAFTQRVGEAFAQRLLRETDGSVDGLVKRAFELALQRLPTKRERELARSWFQTETATSTQPGTPPLKSIQQFCVALLNLNEFVYVD